MWAGGIDRGQQIDSFRRPRAEWLREGGLFFAARNSIPSLQIMRRAFLRGRPYGDYEWSIKTIDGQSALNPFARRQAAANAGQRKTTRPTRRFSAT
jgi:hypothetical protein